MRHERSAAAGRAAGLGAVALLAFALVFGGRFGHGGNVASAGNGGYASASANGGVISIGDVNSGGNSGNTIRVGDTR